MKTKLSRKNLAITVLLIVLAASNVVLAVLYMTKNATITGGVLFQGAIELYEEDGVTTFAGIDFPMFDGGPWPGIDQWRVERIFINNTGNQPVYLYWNISSSTLPWTIHNTYNWYYYGDLTYTLYLDWEFANTWTPRGGINPPDTVILGVGESQKVTIVLFYSWNTHIPSTTTAFNIVTSFYAENA